MRSLLIAGGLLLAGNVFAQEKSNEVPVLERHERMLKLAKSYVVQDDQEAKCTLQERPIFSWAAPERQAIGGELYLWTLVGRPMATIGIWTYDDVRDSHELQSLSTGPLAAHGADGLVWEPAVGGLEFTRLEGASAPHRSVGRRQTQMRALLRERFSAEMIRNGSNRTLTKLRLLTRPIYRYDPLPADVVDGAMFAYAVGTDPEVFVLLEVRRKDDELAWYYAFAPSTSVEVRGKLDAELVWDSTDQKEKGTFFFKMNRQ